MQKRNKSVTFRPRLVHFNEHVERFQIPRKFCTFRRISSKAKLRTSWKWLQNYDCEVKRDPQIFQQSHQRTLFQTECRFICSNHHQLPRYYTKSYDPKAVQTNAFFINWNLEAAPYVNPLWSLIPNVLDTISKEQVKVIIVLPFWTQNKWFP